MSIEVNKTDRIVNVTVEKKFGKSIEADIDIAGQRVGFKQEGEANFTYIDLPKLEFDDLTQGQKDSLKLTFDQLTQAEKDSLKGSDANVTLENIESALGGKPVLKNELIANVKDFGALGNGVNDDSEAIENTITYIFENGGGSVYYPPGIYIAEDLSVYSGITHKAENWKSSTIKLKDNSTFPLFRSKINDNLEGAYWVNLQLEGIGTSETHGIDISLSSLTQECGISNCYIHNFNKGVNSSGNDRMFHIVGNRFWYNDIGFYINLNHPNFGINDFRNNRIGVGGNVIYDVQFVGTKFNYNEYGVYSESNSLDQSMFVGCMFFANTNTGLIISNRNKVVGCMFAASTSAENFITTYGQKNVISNNEFKNETSNALSGHAIRTVGGNSIIGNNFTDLANAIYKYYGSNNLLITNNTYTGLGSGYFLNGVINDSIIKNNIIQNAELFHPSATLNNVVSYNNSVNNKITDYYLITNGVLNSGTPRGGSFTQLTTQENGSIKIKTPLLWTNSRLQFKVKISSGNSSDNESVELLISAYNRASTSLWESISVKTVSSSENKDYNVRFGHDGINACIWIGEVTSTWNYLTCTISDISVGFAEVSEKWLTDWNISLVTSFDTVQITKSNNFPYADFNKLKNKPSGSSGSFTTADGKTVTVTDGIITSIV
jgi:hypothetical protein